MSRLQRKIYQVSDFSCDIRKMTKMFYPIYNSENVLCGYIVTRVLIKNPIFGFGRERVQRIGVPDSYGKTVNQGSLVVRKSLSEEDKLDIVQLYADFLKDNNLRPHYVIDIDDIDTNSKYKEFSKNIANKFSFPKYVIENFFRIKFDDRVMLVHHDNYEPLQKSFKHNNIPFRIMQAAKTPVSFSFLKERLSKNTLKYAKASHFYLERGDMMKDITGEANSFNLKLYISEDNKDDIIIPKSNVFSLKRHSVAIRDIESDSRLSRRIDMSGLSISQNVCAIMLHLNFDDLVSTLKTISDEYDVHVVYGGKSSFEIQSYFGRVIHDLTSGRSNIALVNRHEFDTPKSRKDMGEHIREYYIVVSEKGFIKEINFPKK